MTRPLKIIKASPVHLIDGQAYTSEYQRPGAVCGIKVYYDADSLLTKDAKQVTCKKCLKSLIFKNKPMTSTPPNY